MAHLLQDAVLVDLMSGQDTSAAGARAEIQLDEFGVKLLAIMKTPRSPN